MYRVIDNALGFNSRVRVVALEEYPFTPQRSIITLGDPPRFIVDILDEMESNNSLFWQPNFISNINVDSIIEEILEKIDLGQVEGFLPLWRRFPTVNDTTPAPPEPPEEDNSASGSTLASGTTPASGIAAMSDITPADNGDNPEPPAPPPLPDGVYSITHVPHVDLHHDEQWQELVQSGSIIPDAIYAGAYAGEFEDAVTEAVIKVLAALPTVGG